MMTRMRRRTFGANLLGGLIGCFVAGTRVGAQAAPG